MDTVKPTTALILHPEHVVRKDRDGNRLPPIVSDYVRVRRIDTHGTWGFGQLLTLPELAQLSGLRDRLAGVKRRRK
jgi:hypothetical protein